MSKVTKLKIRVETDRRTEAIALQAWRRSVTVLLVVLKFDQITMPTNYYMVNDQPSGNRVMMNDTVPTRF